MTPDAADRLAFRPEGIDVDPRSRGAGRLRRGAYLAIIGAAIVALLVVVALRAAPVPPAPTSVLYVLHGFAGSPGDVTGGYHLDVTAATLAEAGYIERVQVVALDAGQAWGTDVDVMAQIASYEAKHPTSRRYIAGFSMGGYIALELAFDHPGTFAGVGAISPGIAPPERPWVAPLHPSPIDRVFLGYGTEDHDWIIAATDDLGREIGVEPVVVPGGHDLVVQLALIPEMLRELLGA